MPMSVAFLCAAEDARVTKVAVERRRPFPEDAGDGPQIVRLTKPPAWIIQLAQLTTGRALVQADTYVQVGCEIFLPSPDGSGFCDNPKTVAAIDRTARAAMNEWVITWTGPQSNPPTGAPLVQARLAPEWFAQLLLRWLHETAVTRAAVRLTGFAEQDVPLDSVVELANGLASDGLITVSSSANTPTATLTAHGVAVAEQAAADRANHRQRAEALRRGMITWLADRENSSDTPNDWKSFLRDPRSTFCGDFFTVSELAREAQYLAEHGLIRGLTHGGQHDFGWTRPTMTAKGRDCNDYRGGNVAESLNSEHPVSGTHVSVNTSPGAQINVGNHNTQNAAPAPPAAARPPAEHIAWGRRVWNFINGLSGVGILVGTGVLVYLTYVLVHQH
jgi:hypothetical protein